MRSFDLEEYLLKETKIITVPGLEYSPSRDLSPLLLCHINGEN